MQIIEIETLLIMAISSIQLLAVVILINDIRENPSKIQIGVMESILRIFKPISPAIELVMYKALLSRFYRESLVFYFLLYSLNIFLISNQPLIT